jgi:hypothetical protein
MSGIRCTDGGSWGYGTVSGARTGGWEYCESRADVASRYYLKRVATRSWMWGI